MPFDVAYEWARDALETNDKGNVTKGEVTKRIKELKKTKSVDDADELALLQQYAKLNNAESKAEKEIKAAEAELEVKLLEKYGKLTEADAKTLVVGESYHIADRQVVWKSKITQFSVRCRNRRFADPARFHTLTVPRRPS